MILHQPWPAGADCSVQPCTWFLPLWTSVPLLGKAPTIAGWLQSKNRQPPVVLRHFSPQSPSLSLASSVNCKQEVVKYPPWPGRGNHTGSGDWTLLWSAGQLGGSRVNSWVWETVIRSIVLDVVLMSKHFDLGQEWIFCSSVGTLQVPLFFLKKGRYPNGDQSRASRHKQEGFNFTSEHEQTSQGWSDNHPGCGNLPPTRSPTGDKLCLHAKERLIVSFYDYFFSTI